MLVHSPSLGQEYKSIPVTLHINRESRIETLPYYTPPMDCPGHTYTHEKRCRLSSLWFDANVDTVFIDRTTSRSFDSWACNRARVAGIWRAGSYEEDMLLVIRGEDLSNVQNLVVLDYAMSGWDVHFWFEKEKPAMCYLGLFPGLKAFTLKVIGSYRREFEHGSGLVLGRIKDWFKAFRALKLKTVRAEDVEDNPKYWEGSEIKEEKQDSDVDDESTLR